MMKIMIAGSRSIEEFDLSGYISEDVELIISGGASGIDTLAEKFADKNKLIIYPNYKLYGRAAPLKRNEIMVDLADEILIIWDGKSRGTKYTAEYAKKKNKNVNIIIIWMVLQSKSKFTVDKRHFL